MRIASLTVSCFLTIVLALPLYAAPPSFIAQARTTQQMGISRKCPEHLAAVHGKDRASVEGALQREFLEFRPLAEQALALRAETIKAGQRIKGKMEHGKPLSGEDLALLNQGIVEHMALRKELLEIAESHE